MNAPNKKKKAMNAMSGFFLNRVSGFMVLSFFVEAELLLACFVWLPLKMYSRKFGLRLHGKFGNLLKTADYSRRAGSGGHGSLNQLLLVRRDSAQLRGGACPAEKF